MRALFEDEEDSGRKRGRGKGVRARQKKDRCAKGHTTALGEGCAGRAGMGGSQRALRGKRLGSDGRYLKNPKKGRREMLREKKSPGGTENERLSFKGLD